MSLTPKQARFVDEYLVDLNATQSAIRAGYSLPVCTHRESGAYVYLLTDSTSGRIFYIGKGRGKRFAAHMTEWRAMDLVNPEKCRRIGEIIEGGGRVVPLRFATEMSDDAAYRLERALIAAVGLDRLTNIAPGQETDAERAAYMLSRVKPFDLWVSERPRSEFHQQLYRGVCRSLSALATA